MTNTGNVTLQTVSVSDPTGGKVDCPTPAAPGLAPGASVTCHLETVQTVTAAEVAAGKVLDTATATGSTPGGLTSPVSAPSTAKTPAAPVVLRLRKTASVKVVSAGQDVTYKLVVTNPTKRAIAKVTVCDDLPSSLVFVRASARFHRTDGAYCWTVAKLGAHKSWTIELVANAAPGNGGKIVNRSTATALGLRKPVHADATVTETPTAPVPAGEQS